MHVDFNESVSCFTVVNEDRELNDLISQFWVLEEINTIDIRSSEDKVCEKHFIDNFKRDKNDRMIVKIPFKDTLTALELRKWMCNSQELLNKFVVNEALDACILNIGEYENNKTLGILWSAKTDTIRYSVSQNTGKRDNITKRVILAAICQIYDPLGSIGCVVIIGKLMMQELWRLKISWDEPVPNEIKGRFFRFQEDLKLLNDLKISRNCLIENYTIVELHGFSDSSERAYAACDNPIVELINRTSSLWRAQRSVAYVLRFIHICSKNNQQLTGRLTCDELDKSLLVMRWSREYLSELQTRVKWKRDSPHLLKSGEMVLIKNDTFPAIRWQLGRIIAVHPGPDGVVRVADIRTSRGTFRRSANQLCVLPID
ncbi:hypothetical protein NQ317_014814 [Molorchus minor]|uniref:DUF5641 domain-containing protein n=1 Tax=Molorchus minor TaxID=1323400 RepID=A0ABQ9IWW1_9CUCU|nr:hypothetical protein NQ317_014814 [Molorchus minor]